MRYGKNLVWLLGALVLALVLCTGCSDDDDDTTTPPADDTTEATIGATGGTIERDGEASLEIPSGALDADVDFTMDENDSPTAMVSSRETATPVFSIGPDGTQFDTPATLTLTYDEADLNGADEQDIVIYTDSGSGWNALTTTVDAGANTATAEISHLSDYVATIPYGEAAEGVYAVLEVTRIVNYLGIVNNTDMITARFDTVVDPCHIHHALHPDSVSCNTYGLVWDEMTTSYIDENLTQEFLVPGDEYTFTVDGNDEVPDLTQAVTMPSVCPYITNISQNQVVPKDGFTVEWTDTDAGTVFLGLIPQGSDEVVEFETDNDGTHTFAAADLADLPTGTYALNLIKYNRATVTATGYDPNSIVDAGSLNVVLVNLSDDSAIGPDGGVVALGEDGYLDIPAGALAGSVDFTATVNESPTAAPDGWTFVTPVYTVGPASTSFTTDAEIVFNYDTTQVGSNDESTITIFTNDGSGWVALSSTVYEILSQVASPVSHLSDFVAMVEVDTPAEGVYCEIEIRRAMYYVFSTVARSDELRTRFDTVVDPEPDTPLDADGVSFGTLDLDWDSGDEAYEYDCLPSELHTLGQTYNLVVDGDEDVPDLTLPITFVDAEPYITNFESDVNVLTTGFDIEWGGTNGGTAHLAIMDQSGAMIIDEDTPNDGLYSVTSTQLASAQQGLLLVDLTYESEGTISATGYDPASTWSCYSINTVTLMLADPVK